MRSGDRVIARDRVIGKIKPTTETRRHGENRKVEIKQFMKLTKSQAKQIRALKRMKDEDIDFSDIPEKTDWSGAVVGKFYRPIKKLVTVRKNTNKKSLKPTMH